MRRRLAQELRLLGVARSGRNGMDCDAVGAKFNLTDVAAHVRWGQLAHLECFTQQRHALARARLEGFATGHV